MVVEALSVQLKPLNDPDARPAAVQLTVPQQDVSDAIDLGYLHAVLGDKLQGRVSYQGWVLTLLEDRLVISLPSDELFERGTTRLTDKARNLAADLSSVLSSVRNQMEVDAHLLPGTAVPKGYESGWDFSTARAVTFTRALQEAGFERKVAAVGFSASRFHDISDKLSLDRRRALGRRIDVVIRRPG
jgi:chemotaxis protein MotB